MAKKYQINKEYLATQMTLSERVNVRMSSKMFRTIEFSLNQIQNKKAFSEALEQINDWLSHWSETFPRYRRAYVTEIHSDLLHRPFSGLQFKFPVYRSKLDTYIQGLIFVSFKGELSFAYELQQYNAPSFDRPVRIRIKAKDLEEFERSIEKLTTTKQLVIPVI